MKQSHPLEGSKYFCKTYTPLDSPIDLIHQKIRSSILWSVYGDACGMPFEGQPPIGVYDRNDSSWVTCLTTPKNSFSTYLSKGGWTDDTQLKIALISSYLESRSWDMDTIVKHHIRSQTIGMRGWGGSTRESVKRLSQGCSWKKSGKPGGAGNGIAMKISPVGLSYAVTHTDQILSGVYPTEMINMCRNIAIMTHRDSRAIVSSIAHSMLVSGAVLGIDPMSNWGVFYDHILKIEKMLPDMGDTISSRLQWIPDNLDRGVEFFAHLFRVGCYVIESYPFCIAMYLLYRDDVKNGILAAVNAGGDCDTTAAIVGDLCGAEAGILDEELKEIEQYNNLLGMTDEFYLRTKRNKTMFR